MHTDSNSHIIQSKEDTLFVSIQFSCANNKTEWVEWEINQLPSKRDFSASWIERPYDATAYESTENSDITMSIEIRNERGKCIYEGDCYLKLKYTTREIFEDSKSTQRKVDFNGSLYIDVDNEVYAKGTVHLHATRRSRNSLFKFNSSLGALPESVIRKRQKTIFVQDDIVANTLLCKMLWEKEGYKVVTCNDITKAYDMIINARPHLIFCDILEPNDANGIEFCSFLKDEELTKDIPFCFLTSLYDHKSFIEGVKAGANGYVTKPTTPYDMTSYITNLMKSMDGGYVPRRDNSWSIYKEIPSDCIEGDYYYCKNIRSALLKIEKEEPETWERRIWQLLEASEYFTDEMLTDDGKPLTLRAPYIEFTIDNEALYQTFVMVVRLYKYLCCHNKSRSKSNSNEYPVERDVFVIPEGTKAITRHTFDLYAGSRTLKEVVIPGSVKSIEADAFSGCDSLLRIVLSSGIKEIPEGAFRGYERLEEVSFPDTIERIGDYAFYGCSSLRSVVLPSGMRRLGQCSFFKCTSLEMVVLPDSLKEIGDRAFFQCTSLHSINIPGSVEIIGDHAFYGDDNLPVIDGIQYADTCLVEAVDKEASTISIKEGTRFIAGEAFYGCKKIVSVELPESVEYIGASAFWECGSLRSVNLPEKLRYMGQNVFRHCKSLQEIGIPPRIGISTIPAWTFCCCFRLTSLQIPNCVTKLGYGAFSGCKQLQSAVIPTNVSIIDDYSFQNCSSLHTVIIENKDVTIGKDVFKDCNALKTVLMPNGIRNMVEQPFWHCCRLRDIIIQGKPHSIDRSQMDYESLKTLISKLRSRKYYSCLNVLSVENSDYPRDVMKIEISNDIEIIGSNTFENYSNLEKITLSERIFAVLEKGFKDCTALKHINLPNSLTSIGKLAFHNCIHIKELELPKGISYIDENAFSGCISLSSISIPEGITEIKPFTFSGCHSLTKVFLPSSVTTIHPDAFRDCGKLMEIHLDRSKASDLRLYRTAFLGVPFECIVYIHIGEICNFTSLSVLSHKHRYIDVQYSYMKGLLSEEKTRW